MTASSPHAPPARPPPPRRVERGAGLISSIGGLLVFLVLLTVATHLLVGLYARSEVTDAAYQAARRVAVSGAPRDEIAFAQAAAARRMGDVGNDATFEWTVNAEVVRLRVQAAAPSLLLPIVSDGLGVERIDRTVTVRIEEPVG
ncbi:MAG: hypothetical protein H0V33_11845 [Acidimicrobiia bacterium]|jgi:hypothetical protein|nr:hypothetical protein [Acidimicrobiia bacterium]